MWVSQTYLGNFDTNSDVYLYYFWEAYGPNKDVPAVIREGLAKLGYNFRDQVSVFTPMQEYLGYINAEMEEKFREFWWTFQGKTPGIFLCRKPLRDFDPTSGEWLYFPISAEILNDSQKVANFFTSLHSKCREEIEFVEKRERKSSKPQSLLAALYESANLKLTFMGAGVDFKPLISAIRSRSRR